VAVTASTRPITPRIVRLGTRSRVDAVFDPGVPPWSELVDGLEEYGLKVTVLDDLNQVTVQSGHSGRRLVVWQLDTQRVAYDLSVEASYPLVFANAVADGNTLWAASSDTLFEFEPSNWQLRWSARLRSGPNGSFVGWLSIDADRHRLIIGWQRRAVRGRQGFAEPAGGDVLALDTATRELTALGQLPSWTSSAVVQDASSALIIQQHPIFGAAIWRTAIRPQPRALYPPRPPGHWDWR
jgi:hypothetical protein